MAPGVEFADLDWLTIGLAVLVNMIIGFVWYSKGSPTGKIWMKEMGMSADTQPTSKQLMTGLILMVIGAFLLMFILQHTFVAYRDAYMLDGARTGANGLTFGDGATGAFFVWLGFFVPVYLSTVAWEGRSWKLFFVNVMYYLVTLQIAGALFAWRI